MRQAVLEPSASSSPRLPSFAAALRVWLRIGLLSFGGPAGQIALLHREVVDERHWIGERRFLHALNYCALLPGPEATQLATYIGWLMHGARGGLAAGLLFIVPGVAVMLGLSIVYAVWGTVPLVAGLFFGLKAAVLVLVVEALLRIARRALKGGIAWCVAGIAFVALFLFNLPFPLVVLAAGAVGALRPDWFVGGPHGQAGQAGTPALLDALLEAEPERVRRLARSARRAGLVALALWLAPVALLLPIGGVFGDIAWFFSKMAVVTFGGAYAVLAYVAQEAVQHYHWLSAQEMLAGLGLAETTPGPLILVLQFVGFMAGYRADGLGLAGGALGALVTLWVTFAPCFVFVFLGAPLIERLQANRVFAGALAGITAAVVGVIANLALWFGLRVLFGSLDPVALGPIVLDLPVIASIDARAVLVAALAVLTLFVLRQGLVRTVAICAGAGLLLQLVAAG